MTHYPLPVSCDVTVRDLVQAHPVVLPLLERAGISVTQHADRGLHDAARAACVAAPKLCDTIAATIEAGRIEGCWWP